MKLGFQKIAVFVSALAVLGVLAGGCGLPLDWLEEWDETCYDCRTVCEGTDGDTRDECLSSCHECQGYSSCFQWMDGTYAGMSNSMQQWESVNCSEVD